MLHLLRAIFFQSPLTATEACVLVVTGAGVFLPQPPPDGGAIPWLAWWAIVGAAAFLLVRGLIGIVSLSLARSPVKAHRTATGFAVDVRVPTIRRKRKLKQETLALVAEIRTYLKSQPNPSVQSMARWEAQQQEMRTALDEASKSAIFWRYNSEDSADHAVQKDELTSRFAARVRVALGQFAKRGRISDHDADLLMWQAGSLHWMREAAVRLEALALDL